MALHLSLRILSIRELRNDEILVPTFVLINESYKEHEGEGVADRFPTPEDFLQDLEVDGLCAIIQDSEKSNLPVAVVVAKRWKGRQDEANIGAHARDWEIGPAASRNLPQYRKRGLIERCLQGISPILLDRAEE